MDCSNIKSGGAVYFAEIGNVIKIGVSADIDTRVEELRYHTGKTVNVLGMIHGGYEAEHHMHHRFREYRLYEECFSRATGLMDFIDGLDRNLPCYSCHHRLGEASILQDELDIVTRRVIKEAIAMVGNRNVDISKRIGMSNRNLYRVRRKLGI